MSVFSENLKKIRNDRGMTQEELASKINSTKQVLSRYENGVRVPKISMVQKIADALNVSIPELTGDQSIPELEEQGNTVSNPSAWIRLTGGISKFSAAELDQLLGAAIAINPNAFRKEEEEQ